MEKGSWRTMARRPSESMLILQTADLVASRSWSSPIPMASSSLPPFSGGGGVKEETRDKIEKNGVSKMSFRGRAYCWSSQRDPGGRKKSRGEQWGSRECASRSRGGCQDGSWGRFRAGQVRMATNNKSKHESNLELVGTVGSTNRDGEWVDTSTLDEVLDFLGLGVDVLLSGNVVLNTSKNTKLSLKSEKKGVAVPQKYKVRGTKNMQRKSF